MDDCAANGECGEGMEFERRKGPKRNGDRRVGYGRGSFMEVVFRAEFSFLIIDRISY